MLNAERRNYGASGFTATCVLSLLTACAQQPQPVAPTPTPVAVTSIAVCPPSPPAGSGLVCAPPLLCRDASEVLALDQEWYVRLFTTPDQRANAAKVVEGLEGLFCGPTTPVGKAMRMRL